MKDGVIQQIGTPQEVFNSPANIFVAGFIGVPMMNFYDAKLLKQNGKYFVQVENAVIELSEEKQENLRKHNVEAQDITAGVRPDHISLKGDPDKMIQGKVDVSEMMGSEVHIHINAMGKDGIIIVPTLDLDSDIFAIGSDIKFTFGGNVINVFDVSGDNLEFKE